MANENHRLSIRHWLCRPAHRGLASTGHFVGLASLGQCEASPWDFVCGPHRPGVPRESASPPLPLGGLRLCVAHPLGVGTSLALGSLIRYGAPGWITKVAVATVCPSTSKVTL